MKFFYALGIFALSVYLFFWTLVFIVPTPRIYDTEGFVNTLNLTDEEKANNLQGILKSFESNKVGEKNYFESDLDKKRNSAIFIAATITSIAIVIAVVFFHQKSYIIFPLVSAFVVSLILYSTIWIFNQTLGANFYLEIQQIRQGYESFKAIFFLGPFLAIFALMLLFGSWYKMPR